VLDSVAVTIKLKTASGDKHKLSLMRGTGAFGKLGGGEAQQEGNRGARGMVPAFRTTGLARRVLPGALTFRNDGDAHRGGTSDSLA
jgi:hypothetical protein